MHSGILNGLDDGQKAAVTSDSRRILVVAPPGSGKTRVLASRFARLLIDGVDSEGILAITFTNRAATEMRERIEGLSARGRQTPAALNVGTFHAFCLKFLKAALPAFTLIGRDEGVGILKELGVKNPAKAADRISFLKNLSCPGALGGNSAEDDLRALSLYEERLRKNAFLDLDDLVIETVNILEAGGGLLPRLSFVLADEFQDINPAQSRLIKLLAARGAGVFAIGDPDQSVYGFRGADASSFMDFERDYPGAEVIRLKNNYRSAERIVRASQSLISNNLKRMANVAEPQAGGGEVRLIECPDGKAEAEFIIREIERNMGGLSSLTVGGGASARRFSDFAVLFRTNRQAGALVDAFSRSSIPFHHATAPGPDIKRFIAHLKTQKGFDGNLSALIKSAGGEIRLEPALLELLVQRAAVYDVPGRDNALDAFLDEMILMEPPDNLDIKADRVNLLTMHASKGLEFSCVFIAGAEEGLIPLAGAGTDVEEERRLFYVAMTRAKDTLYVLNARSRRANNGEAKKSDKSRFLAELPATLLNAVSLDKKPPGRRAVQKGLFE